MVPVLARSGRRGPDGARSPPSGRPIGDGDGGDSRDLAQAGRRVGPAMVAGGQQGGQDGRIQVAGDVVVRASS